MKKIELFSNYSFTIVINMITCIGFHPGNTHSITDIRLKNSLFHNIPSVYFKKTCGEIFYNVVKTVLKILLLLLLSVKLYAQDTGAAGLDPDTVIIPGPDPFSLDADSAIYCIDLLKGNRFIEFNNDTGKSTITEVHTVWSFFLGLEENYPEGHQLRYDIIVNDTPLDWNNSFIEYGGEMINLRLLFTYRNQYPSRDLKYRFNP